VPGRTIAPLLAPVVTPTLPLLFIEAAPPAEVPLLTAPGLVLLPLLSTAAPVGAPCALGGFMDPLCARAKVPDSASAEARVIVAIFMFVSVNEMSHSTKRRSRTSFLISSHNAAIDRMEHFIIVSFAFASTSLHLGRQAEGTWRAGRETPQSPSAGAQRKLI
jgi:hypothetical protein